MSKKPKKKKATKTAKPKTKPGFEYLYEAVLPGSGGAAVDYDRIQSRLNEIGRDGWQLICFTATVFWCMRATNYAQSKAAQTPPAEASSVQAP
jgi:hypothetical protein